MQVVSEWSLPVRVRRTDFLLIRREDSRQRDLPGFTPSLRDEITHMG
jgi:hypothetical protein